MKILHIFKYFVVLGAVFFAVIVALNYALVDLVEKTERFKVVQQLEDLNQYFDKQLSDVELSAEQWSRDDNVSSIFIKNSLDKRSRLFNAGKFSDDSIHFFSLLDISKQIIVAKSFNPENKKFQKLHSKIKYLMSKSEFISFLSTDKLSSIFIYTDKMYLLAVSPVYRTSNSEYVSGYLVIGREMTEADIEHDNYINIELTPINLAKIATQVQIIEAFEKNDFLHMRNNSEINTSMLIRGINSQPLMMVSLSRPLANIKEIIQISSESLLVLLSACFGVAYLFWWNRKKTLVNKVKQLELDIRNVRIGSELSGRLSCDNRGMLNGIVTEFNQKMGGFEKTFVENRKHDAEIVLNELPLEAYLKDIELKYITVNKKYCESLGFKKPEIVGRTDSELMPSDISDLMSKNEQEVIRLKESKLFEEVLYNENKGKVHYSIQMIPFMNSKEQVEGVVGVRIDVTDQKLAEEEMAMAIKVLENTAEGVMVTDANRRVVHVNAAYTEMTGYGEEDLLDKVPLLLQTKSLSKTYQEIQHRLQQDGVWKGELWSSRKDGSSYPEMINIKAITNKQGEITNYFSMSNDITEQKKWQEQLYQMAHYDALTGLPNRTLFKDRLSQEITRCERNKKNAAVLFVDLDLFKSINDSLGHAAGDTLLKIIATRLRPTLRNADSIARMGGDEFTILVTDLALDYRKNIGYLTRLCEKIIDVVKQPMEIEGREINVTCSIGIAVYPVDANNDEDLLRNADSAMYYAKSQGRRNYQFYSKEFNEKAVERLETEIDFRAALKSGALQLYYQPQVDVISRHVVGAEALLRWNKAGKMVLEPERIVVLAEETGLIYELGNWILMTACIECKKWMLQGHKNLRVAVNLSTRQFRQKNLVAIIENILQETGLPGRLLELEVTESALMENIDYSIEMMAELSKKGIRWSLDDFGTGYSSLNYLRDFPVHVLKVDQSFVREITVNLEDSAIVATIIDLAHKLHLTVIAEGVENEEQLKVLGRMSCELVQGYYFSKPVTAQDFIKYVEKGL